MKFPKNVFPVILCLLGCSYQVTDISNRFFKYSTNTNIKLLLDNFVASPSVSICFNIIQNMRKFLEENFGKNISRNTMNIKTMEVFDNLTIADIFDHSVPTSHLLGEAVNRKSCIIRKEGKFVIPKEFWMPKEECMKHISIRRYINRFLMCYKLGLINHDNILEHEPVSFSPAFPGLMLIYYLNPDMIRNYTIYSASVHSHASSDLYDSSASVEHFVNLNWTPTITASYSPIRFTRKEYPYDTDCHSIPGFKSIGDYQLQKLSNLTIKHLKYVHPLNFIYENHSLPLISPYKLYFNESFHKKFSELEKISRKGKNTNCDVLFHITNSFERTGSDMRIDVSWPKETGVHVINIPSYESIDYMIYVLSSIGIWFGLSIFSITSWTQNFTIKQIEEKYPRTISRKRKESNICPIKYSMIKDWNEHLRSQIRRMQIKLQINKSQLDLVTTKVNVMHRIMFRPSNTRRLDLDKN